MPDLRTWFTENAPEEQRDELLGELDAYDTRFSELEQASRARTEELSGRVASQMEEINSLKARNYDLLMQLPSDSGATVDATTEEGEVIHISDLFKPMNQGGN